MKHEDGIFERYTEPEWYTALYRELWSRGITVHEAMDNAKMSPSYLLTYVSRQKMPPKQIFERICNANGLDANDIPGYIYAPDMVIGKSKRKRNNRYAHLCEDCRSCELHHIADIGCSLREKCIFYRKNCKYSSIPLKELLLLKYFVRRNDYEGFKKSMETSEKEYAERIYNYCISGEYAKDHEETLIGALAYGIWGKGLNPESKDKPASAEDIEAALKR